MSGTSCSPGRFFRIVPAAIGAGLCVHLPGERGHVWLACLAIGAGLIVTIAMVGEAFAIRHFSPAAEAAGVPFSGGDGHERRIIRTGAWVAEELGKVNPVGEFVRGQLKAVNQGTERVAGEIARQLSNIDYKVSFDRLVASSHDDAQRLSSESARDSDQTRKLTAVMRAYMVCHLEEAALGQAPRLDEIDVGYQMESQRVQHRWAFGDDMLAPSSSSCVEVF